MGKVYVLSSANCAVMSANSEHEHTRRVSGEVETHRVFKVRPTLVHVAVGRCLCKAMSQSTEDWEWASFLLQDCSTLRCKEISDQLRMAKLCGMYTWIVAVSICSWHRVNETTPTYTLCRHDVLWMEMISCSQVDPDLKWCMLQESTVPCSPSWPALVVLVVVCAFLCCNDFG